MRGNLIKHLKGLPTKFGRLQRLNRWRKQIETIRGASIQHAAERVATGGVADVAHHIRQLETCDKLLASLPPPRTLPIAIALLCLITVGLAWSLPMSVIKKTQLTVKVQAQAVMLKLAAPLSWQDDLDLYPHNLRVEQLTKLSLRVPGIEQLEGNPWIHIDGGRVSLTKLEFGTGGVLQIETYNDQPLNIYVRKAAFRGELELSAAVQVSAGQQTNVENIVSTLLNLEPPETLELFAKASPVSTRLQIDPKEVLVMDNLQVESMSFSRDIPTKPGSITFVPTIANGEVFLRDVDTRIKLERGDRLSLQEAEGRIMELRVDKGIEMRFAGTARGAKIGSLGSEYDFTPTVLEYLYHNKKLILFGSAVTLIWGILWGMKNILFP